MLGEGGRGEKEGEGTGMGMQNKTALIFNIFSVTLYVLIFYSNSDLIASG